MPPLPSRCCCPLLAPRQPGLAPSPPPTARCVSLCSRYKYFIFLNSSIKGPFVPNYMPQGWQWTQVGRRIHPSELHSCSVARVPCRLAQPAAPCT